MHSRDYVRVVKHVLGWGIAGFVASFILVYFFVDADMVLLYYLIGAIVGMIGGLAYAVGSRRQQVTRAA